VAFLPSNVIPGIDFSDDPLLQGRLFSYLDTQKSRLGTANFHQIPVNAPKCPFQNFQRDGMMQMGVFKGRANYEPNSLAQAGEDAGPRESPLAGFVSAGVVSLAADPEAKLRIRAQRFADHYTQARLFYRSQAPIEQAHIASALVFELSKVELEHVRTRVVASLRNVDQDLAKRVAGGLAMPLPPPLVPAVAPIEMAPSPALSIVGKMQSTLVGRKVGILFDEGSNKAEIDQVNADVKAAGGSAMLIAPKIGAVKLKGGTLKADGQLAGTPSVLFDAVAIVLTREAAAKLTHEAAAVDFLRDAFGHLKAIGCTRDAAPLLEKAGIVHDDGITGLDKTFIVAAGKRFFERESKVRTLA
jgi:catalase